MMSYMMMIAVIFTYVGSSTTHYLKQKEIRRLIKTHKKEVEKTEASWYRVGWRDGVLYQKSTNRRVLSQ